MKHLSLILHSLIIDVCYIIYIYVYLVYLYPFLVYNHQQHVFLEPQGITGLVPKYKELLTGSIICQGLGQALGGERSHIYFWEKENHWLKSTFKRGYVNFQEGTLETCLFLSISVSSSLFWISVYRCNTCRTHTVAIHIYTCNSTEVWIMCLHIMKNTKWPQNLQKTNMAQYTLASLEYTY